MDEYDETPSRDGTRSLRVHWDGARWACRCAAYILKGKCSHLISWKEEENVIVKEEYL